MRRPKQCAAPLIYDQSTYVNDKAGDLWELQAPYGYKKDCFVAAPARAPALMLKSLLCVSSDRRKIALPSCQS